MRSSTRAHEVVADALALGIADAFGNAAAAATAVLTEPTTVPVGSSGSTRTLI